MNRMQSQACCIALREGQRARKVTGAVGDGPGSHQPMMGAQEVHSLAPYGQLSGSPRGSHPRAPTERIYLNGYVPNLQVGGQVVSFLTAHLGNPIPSPAILEKIGTAFRRAVASFAADSRIGGCSATATAAPTGLVIGLRGCRGM
jgi:hypothetical protein